MIKTNAARRAQAGFTLVEIAIVLVIIGLLLGGILKGQEMITQAKIKNIINDFNGLSAAMYSYQDRYRALPGDDLNAGTRWSGSFPGNGDGQLTGVYNSIPGVTSGVAATPASTTPETNLFWWHMRLAGFVPGSTAAATASITPPGNAVNGLVGVQVGTTTSGLGFTSNIICTSNLPDKVAIAIDSQMDDGTSNSGQVRAQLQDSPNPAIGVTAASAYAENGTNQYVLCKAL